MSSTPRQVRTVTQPRRVARIRCHLCTWRHEKVGGTLEELERLSHSHYMRTHWLSAQLEAERAWRDSLGTPPALADRPLAVSLPRTTENENDSARDNAN